MATDELITTTTVTASTCLMKLSYSVAVASGSEGSTRTVGGLFGQAMHGFEMDDAVSGRGSGSRSTPRSRNF